MLQERQVNRQRLAKLGLAGLLCLLCYGPVWAALPELDAVSTFSALPPIRNIDLSPDGTKAVVLAPVDDTYHVAALDLDTGKRKLLMAADPEKFLFNWCRFANNERVVCSIRSYIIPKSAAANIPGTLAFRGGRIVATRLLAVNVDGSKQVQLIKQKRSRIGGQLEWIDPVQDKIVSWLPEEPDQIMVALAREDRTSPSVYRLNINTNRLKKVQGFRKGIFGWGADRNGRIIHGFGQTRSGKPLAIHMQGGVASDLDISHLTGEEPLTPLGYSASGDSAYLLANAGKDTRSVVEVDSRTARIMSLFPHSETHDSVGLLRTSASDRLLASIELADNIRYRWLDRDVGVLYEKVKGTLPGSPRNVLITNADAAANRVVFYAWGSNTRPTYYLFDRSKNALTRLATAYSDLPVEQMNSYEPVRFQARDGLEIPAYLTLPANHKAAKLPTVIIPHGGPYARDEGIFDYRAQFLASLGYAVLQPNYRGSAGYGDAYMAKGFKQWGLAMQDDLDDGLAWMIKQGYTDPNRVCMLGGSYGGYAALVAGFRSTDKYRCAVSFAGVSDLDALVDRWGAFYNGTSATRRVQSGALRDQSSPLNRVNDIDIPLLIVHGDVDDRVPIGHSRSLVAALKKRNKPHTYIELANGDHFLSLQSHREAFLAAVKDFLAEHIGAKTSATALGGD